MGEIFTNVCFIHAILAVEYINSQYEREARLKKKRKKFLIF